MDKQEKTPVIFRREAGGDAIIALFPTILAEIHECLCLSYSHVGQHSAADYDYVMRFTVPAKPQEWKSLYAELQSIGYDNLRVYSRRTSKMRQELLAERWIAIAYAQKLEV